MKIIVPIVIVISLVSFSTGKTKSTLKWGMVGIEKELVVDDSEITVGEWLEYIYYHDQTSIGKYISGFVSKKRTTQQDKNLLKRPINNTKLVPSSIVLKQRKLSYLFQGKSTKTLITNAGINGRVLIPVDSIIYSKNRNRVLRDIQLPISGITYKQAINFCKWRTQLDSLKFKQRYNLPASELDSIKSEYYSYHLPSKEEFIKFNCNKDSLSQRGYSNFNYLGSIPKRNKPPTILTGKDLIQPWIKLYQNDGKIFSKNPFSNLYHIQGNVAEMSNIKGISYGGSYLHPAKQSYAGVPTKYESPQIWLGFRCVGKKLVITHR